MSACARVGEREMLARSERERKKMDTKLSTEVCNQANGQRETYREVEKHRGTDLHRGRAAIVGWGQGMGIRWYPK